ncbi:MAG TPA: carboxypeptidase-like regulatory domain-containing protein [Gemmatimonadaceae bacterium]|nr:carboxypeptidase-like regulatory domain-containing protein [Gemmatimonadaceae bacterium]
MSYRTRMVVARAAALSVIAFTAVDLEAQSPVTYLVAGVVVDQNRNPVAAAELSIGHGSRAIKTRTNEAGRFDFGRMTAGSVEIVVHRLGFQERTLTVDVGSSPSPLEIALLPVAADIDAVVIEASGGRLQEFTDHRKQSKFGHFFDQNDIRTKSPRFVSELFRGIPGARLAPAAGSGSKVLLRGCRPKIWIDGVLAQDAEIDEVISPSEIAGIEIYPSWAGIPAQYMDRENRACGAVLIWSRQS